MLENRWVAALSALLMSAACSSTAGTSGSSVATSTGSTSTGTVTSSATAGSTGRSTTGAVTGSTAETTGATTGRETTGQSSGLTAGTTASSATSATSTGGASSTTIGGSTSGAATTGGEVLPPYQPYDGGPHHERLPLGDAGCTIAAPFPTVNGCEQCRTDTDCPAPSFCEVNNGNICVQCDATHPTCPAGFVCDSFNTLQCLPDCTQNPGACVGSGGGFCDADGGFGTPDQCVSGTCLSDADCPAAVPYCDPGQNACASCILDDATHACPSGEQCLASDFGVAQCGLDCRADAGICRPGLCDADAGQGSIACLPGVCVTDADCADTGVPNCLSGQCVQCTNDFYCATLGIGAPICNGSFCTVACSFDGGACGGGLFCGNLDGGGFLETECVCGNDQDCASQTLAPVCLPLDAALGLDAGAGLYGQCGCSQGGCPSGTVCESRADVLALVEPEMNAATPICVPDCTSGRLSCALDQGFPPNNLCNPNTGYCVGCYDDAQCALGALDAGTPDCVPIDAGVPAGGGICSCVSAASCNDGNTCLLPAFATVAACEPACTYTPSGYDSCLYGFQFSASGLCNTETGACQQCFVDADCNGLTAFSNTGFVQYPTQLCSDAGVCYGCNVPSDCPSSVPGCLLGACGSCAVDSDCPSGDAGLFACSLGICLASCTVDGGQCAAQPATPFCDPSQLVCVQCLTTGDCVDAGFTFCAQGTCE